jgi:hypothetical protein
VAAAPETTAGTRCTSGLDEVDRVTTSPISRPVTRPAPPVAAGGAWRVARGAGRRGGRVVAAGVVAAVDGAVVVVVDVVVVAAVVVVVVVEVGLVGRRRRWPAAGVVPGFSERLRSGPVGAAPWWVEVGPVTVIVSVAPPPPPAASVTSTATA